MELINIYIMIMVLLSLSYIYTLIMLSVQVSITCIVHDLGVLGVIWKIQVIGSSQDLRVVCSYFMDLGSPSKTIVHLLLIREMTFFLSSKWVSHGECTSVYSYILDKTYGESWYWLSSRHDSPNYYATWALNFERILS